MAVVVFAINGQGLGHLIRGTMVSKALASVGERPVIFTEGKYRGFGLTQFPIRLVPPLWGATNEVRERVSSELHSMAGISLPAVVVEDTHPMPIQIPATIRRILLVRPTSFEYLVRLNEGYSGLYSAYLLCDSPDSPTWPYDEAQTRQLTGWNKWHGIGPIYRTASEDEIRQVRLRHNLMSDQEVCVFSMGGGGVKVNDPTGQDVVRFLRLSLKVADAVHKARSRVRLLFVKGPYFPPRIPIPPRFEVVPDEDQMPALLKIAKGAVIRAGFNTPWECIAAGTPFIPLIGTTYAEPVTERMSRLTSLGLVPPDIETFWFDDKWRTEFQRIAKNIVARHSGVPEPRQLSRLILDRREVDPRPKPKPHAIRRSRAKREIPLVIRIDDVVCKEASFCWLLDLLATSGLRANLEVVPYLVEFDETFLDRFDPSRKLFGVSQHGYAHVPRTTDGGRRYEFSPETDAPTAEEVEVLARGKEQMEAAFPNRFNGGFSPPFDALPVWLPSTWHSLGGTFVSCLHTGSVPGAPVPVRRAGVDVWDWSADRAISRSEIMHKLALQAAAEGHTGIVLHPRCLRRRAEKLQLRSLLNYLERRTRTVSLGDIALGKIEVVKSHSGISRLSNRFRGIHNER